LFRVEEVKKGEMSAFVSASGKIKAERDVSLKFQTSGYLAWVGVKKGDFVKKWQAVASLDKKELEKEFKKEMNDYMNERWDFEQTQDDYKMTKERKLVTDSIKRILEKAQFDLENSVLDAEIADLAVKFATIYSPIDGIVVSLDSPYPGVNVTPTTATFRIVDPKSVYFEARIDETDIGKVGLGDQANIKLDAFPGETFSGTVSKIEFDSTTTSGGGTAYNAWISFDEAQEKFKINMNGDAEVVQSLIPDALLVPLSSLSEREGKTYIWKVVERKAQKEEVLVGQTNDEFAQIISGVAEGDKVVTSNISLLKEGMTIKP